ncbi:MAG: DUF695 domain-containing protein [Bacteroidota bacterium]
MKNQKTAPYSLPEWDFYFCTVENQPASIMLDLALSPHIPILGKTELVQVTVKLNDPNEFGLTNPGEAEILYVMEDRLSEHMSVNLGGLYVARNTSRSHRIFYFYCQSSIDFDGVIEEVMESFSGHQYTSSSNTDPKWNFYREFLYPSSQEYQSILNRRVIEKLEQHGDNLSQAREVEHFLYFPDEPSRTRFISQIHHQRFTICSQGVRHDSSGLPYSLMISRVDRVDPASIDDVVLQLMRLAESCAGEYDGWGTGIVLE